MEVKRHPMLRKLQPVAVTPKPHNARKYCEFHEQNGHTTAECKELKKALHELPDKGKIDCFLKRVPDLFARGATQHAQNLERSAPLR